MTLDTSKISLTTVQGYLSFASRVIVASGGGLIAGQYFRTAAAFGILLVVVGAAQAVIGKYQNDATKPTDSQGKPVPSSEVPVKQ